MIMPGTFSTARNAPGSVTGRPLSWADLVPQVGTRSLFVGHTGSGKSELMKPMAYRLSNYQPVLLFDVKGDSDFDGFMFTDPAEISGRIYDRMVWRPDIDSDIVGDADRILRGCFRRGDMCLVFDDVLGVKEGTRYPNMLEKVFTMGRGIKLTALAGAQRPHHLPLYVISESDNRYVFATELIEDRQRLAGFMGPAVMANPEMYHFWYSSRPRRIKADRQIMLNLKTKGEQYTI